jgi:hypothetical protein
MPEQTRNHGGQGLRTQLGKLVEALENVVFRKVATPQPVEVVKVASAPLDDGHRMLRGLGEALERIAAREAEEATARLHASS